jgi:hypothetical protein
LKERSKDAREDSVSIEESPQRRDLLVGAGSLAALFAVLAPLGRARAQDAAATAPAADPTPGVEFAYEAIVTLEAGTPVGDTPWGARNRIPITGGTFEGPNIKGVVLPSGMDWQLVRADGFLEVYADYMMQADDGALIHVINTGVLGQGYSRTTPRFEAPNGPHEWLNQAVFVGTLGLAQGMDVPAVRIRVWKVV